jgi:hypothetical protein
MTLKQLTELEDQPLDLYGYDEAAEIEEAYRAQFGSYAGIENFIAACGTIEDAKAVLQWNAISADNYGHE